MCSPHVPPQQGEENILIVGTLRQILAKFNMAVFWALGAEIFGPSKHDNLPDLVHNILYTMLYTFIYNMIYIIPCAGCCGPSRSSIRRTALFCWAYWTLRAPTTQLTAGAAVHSLQPSSQSDVAACSTSMHPGGPQSAYHMDPQLVAIYIGGNLFQQHEYRH